MAPISTLFSREDSSANSSLAYYLLITSTALFVGGIITIISLCVFRRVRRNRKAKLAQANSEPSEKAAFLAEEAYNSRQSVPAIHLTFPEEHAMHGNRHSRVVVVTLADTGSVGYAPYEEPLPMYQQKESPGFHNLDLERLGGLREDQIGRGY